MVKALYEKQLKGINDIAWQELEARVMTTIRLCLDNDVMYHVMDKESSTMVFEQNLKVNICLSR
jgi:hypothetical protein